MTANTKDFQERLCSDKVATILNGATVSDAVFLNGTSLVAIDVPTGLEGTSLTFQVSPDNSASSYKTYKRMIDGAAVTAVIGADASYAAGQFDFSGYNWIKLVLATQTGDIEITLKTRPL